MYIVLKCLPFSRKVKEEVVFLVKQERQTKLTALALWSYFPIITWTSACSCIVVSNTHHMGGIFHVIFYIVFCLRTASSFNLHSLRVKWCSWHHAVALMQKAGFSGSLNCRLHLLLRCLSNSENKETSMWPWLEVSSILCSHNAFLSCHQNTPHFIQACSHIFNGLSLWAPSYGSRFCDHLIHHHIQAPESTCGPQPSMCNLLS